MTIATPFRWSFVAAAILALLAGADSAAAQQAKPRIWDVPMGLHVSELPVVEFVDPACGTNGGPAGAALAGFEEFEKCPQEASGLREIWFIYDDTAEYIGRALRDPALIGRYRATVVLAQPVILSLLVDPAGRVQGLRIFTDPRADPALRLEAHDVAIQFRARFGSGGWECVDLPQTEGETPLDGIYLKQQCNKESEGRRLTVEARHYHKPGQHVVDLFNRPMVNEYESASRLEVVQIVPRSAPATPFVGRVTPAVADQADRRANFLAGKTVDCPGCDLAAADLRRRNLTGADLSGANLAGAIFHRATLRRANLSGANLEGANLNRAILTQANMKGANLLDAMLYEVDGGRTDFSGADLSYALMGRARLALANFTEANLDFTDLGEARMNDAILAKATLNEAFLWTATLFRADLRGAVLDRAMMQDAELRGANLTGAVLREADLSNVDLSDANLTNADFSAARLGLAKLLNTNQEGTIFAGALMPDDAMRP